MGREWSTCLAFALAVLFLVDNASADLDVLVPAYFYPVNNSPWDDLNDAASQVEITAIMNPGSGPGNSQDTNYVNAVDSLRSAGGLVIGYVHTSFGTRDLNTVLSEIDDYDNWYNIDGIFVDEMANSGPAERLNYYRDIYNHVKSIDPNWTVVGNPGTDTLEQYLTWPTADQFVIFEDFGSAYAGDTTPSWVSDYERTQFAHLIHSESSNVTMQSNLELAVTRNAGSVYITNDVLNNPWDTLPSYWQAQIDAIELFNNSILDADFNENGTVDNLDLALWSNGYGISNDASKYQGDANGDGVVDGRDFLQWQQDYGETALFAGHSASVGNQASAQSLPEPNCAQLLALSVFIFSIVLRSTPASSKREVDFRTSNEGRLHQ